MRPFLCLAALACAALSFADHNRTLPGIRFTVAPKIDGVLDPAEWAAAAKNSNFVHISTGEKLAFDAEIYAGYDSENLYFAFFCPDPDPKSIRATEYRRNTSVDGDDHCIILFNPFNTHQSNDNSEFMVGAGGGTKANFAGGRSAKREWEGAWDAKSRITERGWECEFVIPWKVLRLPESGKRDIEINFARVIPRAQAAIAWCDIGPQERMENNGSWTGVEIPAVQQKREILALPYQILGYDAEREETVFNTGIDLRYNITPQITSLATINPDFRNVEGSVLNLSFSRFERLAEERRPFFVEGQNEFRLGGMSASLFAPQRLDGFDFGVKAFGKLSDNQSFGTLVATQFEHDTAAVARFRQTWGTRSYINAGVVHWDDRNHDIINTASSLELIEWRGNWGGDFIYNSSDDSEIGNGHRMDLDLLFQDTNTFGAVGYQEISEDFLPRIGFAPRKGFKGMNYSLFHSKEYTGGPLSEMNISSSYVDTDKENGDGIYLRSFDFSTSVVTRNALEVSFYMENSNFQGAKAKLYNLSLGYPENDPYRNIGVGIVGGRVDGEKYCLVGVSGNYRFANRISISPSLQSEKLGSETNTLYILGASYEIDRNRSIGGRAVVRDEDTNWYLAFRHSGNVGVEWFVILGDPNADTFQKKLIVKAVIPMTLRF